MKNSIVNFTRGTQLLGHFGFMFAAGFKLPLIISALVVLGTCWWQVSSALDDYQAYLLWMHLYASGYMFMEFDPAKLVNLRLPDGDMIAFPMAVVRDFPPMRGAWDLFFATVKQAVVLSTLCLVPLMALFWWVAEHFGEKSKAKRHLRGARLVSLPELKADIARHNRGKRALEYGRELGWKWRLAGRTALQEAGLYAPAHLAGVSYTNKSDILDNGFQDWTPMVQPGELSPFSRTSVTWPQSRSALKPEVVFEAGNRAINPGGTQASNFDSLSLLTTGENVATHPLVPFAATSAAAAQCAKLATELSAAFPHFWPETIRALIVHSAEWTPWMVQQLTNAQGMTARYPLLRKFGHGVPSFERARASAENHLALIAQNEIRPFKTEAGAKKFSDCHFYRLPWPKDIFEALGEQDVRLKLTLSYFIEPNPGRFASIDAQRYQSYGLRFDLKRRTESEADFVERINALERDDPLGPGPAGGDNAGWRFGPNSISAGSLHCDEWIGPAVALAARDIVCIKPVTGWWKQSAANCKRSGRYSLIATLSAPDLEVDLHTPIQIAVENQVEVEIAF